MRILPLTVFPIFLTTFAQAAVVGYWRFEEGGFLSDSSGNGFHLTNGSGATAASQFTLPGSGNGSAYPTTIPSSGAANGGAVSFDGGDILSTPDNAAFMTTVFTIEAFVTTTTLGATQAIAGQLAGSSSERSYLLAINSSGVLQLSHNVTTTSSNLTPLEPNKDYFVAVTVDMADSSSSGITFYMKNLTDGGEMELIGRTHTGATLNDSTAAFTIGSTASPSSPWNGLIDEVRFSNTKLDGLDLLVPIPEPTVIALAGLGVGMFGLRRRR